MNKENCALKLVDEIILYYDVGRKNIKKQIKGVQSFPQSIHIIPRYSAETGLGFFSHHSTKAFILS